MAGLKSKDMESTSSVRADFLSELTNLLHNGQIKDRSTLLSEKRRVCRSLGMGIIPKNGEILSMLKEEDRVKFYSIFRSKPIRVLSGVNVVALMTKPFDCPHGVCLFCPGGTRFNTPQSYTGFEPAARRAAMNSYDPYKQVTARLNHYLFMGYSPQKIEAILIGGTFTTLPKEYRYDFVVNIYRALNEFYGKKVEGGLYEQKKANEVAEIRCVAMAAETKPERCSDDDIKQLLELGVTRVEMGVQSVFDEVLARNNRGHTIKDVMDTTKRLRDSAYKVDYHVMINLPLSDIDKDRETIKSIYTSEDFKPDAIKIYPTLVIKGTGLYALWERGGHRVYPIEDVISLIAEAEITAPKWLRIMRVERDIPSDMIEDGIKITNLRQLVQDKLDSEGKSAKDIRAREVGHVSISKKPEVLLERENYRASGGDEIFLSFEDRANSALIGFLRLRISDARDAALVRELHIYGEATNIGEAADGSQQHKGFGRDLLIEAERIARNEYSLRKIKIISGVGVREYYRKFGYSLENEYMVKEI